MVPPRQLRLSGRQTHVWLLLPASLLIALFLVYPLAYQLYLSLRAASVFAEGEFVGLRNYVEVLRDPVFYKSLLTTSQFVAASTAMELLWGMALALALRRFTRGRSILRAILLVPLMLPPVAVGSIWSFLFLPEGGSINTILQLLGFDGQTWLAGRQSALLALVTVEVWQYTPFAALVFLAGLHSIPGDVYEAADIDGVSTWQRFRYVTLPLLRMLVVVATVFSVMRQFKTFDTVYTLTAGGPIRATNFISYHIHQTAYRYYNIGEAAALSFLIMIVVVFLGSMIVKTVQTQS